MATRNNNRKDKVMQEKMKSGNFFLLVMILTVFVCVALVFKIQKGMQLVPNCLAVEGFAERSVVADSLSYALCFDRTSAHPEELIKMREKDKEATLKFLTGRGLTRQEITVYDFIEPANHADKTMYRVGFCVSILTDKLEPIIRIKNDMGELNTQGIRVAQQKFEAKHSKIDEIKQELEAEATKNALDRGLQLADKLSLKVEGVCTIRHHTFDVKVTSAIPEGIVSCGSLVPDSITESGALTQKVQAHATVGLELKS